MEKSKTEQLGDQITRFLYEEERNGLDMDHYSELGWRLAVKIKGYLLTKDIKIDQ